MAFSRLFRLLGGFALVGAEAAVALGCGTTDANGNAGNGGADAAKGIDGAGGGGGKGEGAGGVLGSLEGGIGGGGPGTSDSSRASAGGTDAGDASDSDATTQRTNGRRFLYVSGFAHEIANYALDPSGALTTAGATPLDVSLDDVSYHAADPPHRRRFAIAEGTGKLLSYAADPATGALRQIAAVNIHGGPTHVAIDQTGSWAFTADYGDGTVARVAVASDGTFGTPAYISPGQNPHQVVVDPSNQFVFVPCKGSDMVAQYKFSPQTGSLTPNTPSTLAMPQGSGPRHLAFHPNGRFVYLIQELSNEMTACEFHPDTGVLTTFQTLSTLRTSAGGGSNAAAEVWVHPSGRFLYGSNRGQENSIVIYALDANGRMTRVDSQDSGGAQPRVFTIDPAGEFLVAANGGQAGISDGALVAFAIDAVSGKLTQRSSVSGLQQPQYVGISLLPAP